MMNSDEHIKSEILNKSNYTNQDYNEGTSWYISIFLVLNAILGAGIYNFPLAYHYSGGVLYANVIHLLIVLLVTCSFVIFVQCINEKCSNYQDVVSENCGQTISHICLFFVILYTFGVCLTYLIIIGDQWDKFMELLSGNFLKNHPWYLDRKMFMTISSLVIILPLCFAKRIDFLKYASSVGVLSVVYCVLLVWVKYFTGVDGSRVGTFRHEPENAVDLFYFIPTIGISYQCFLSSVPIYLCTKNRNVNHNFTKTIVCSMLISFAIHSLFASFGYLTFGSCVEADILLAYKPTPDIMVAVLGVALKMFVTYPIMAFVGRLCIDDLFVILQQKLVNKNNEATTNHKNKENPSFNEDTDNITNLSDTDQQNIVEDTTSACTATDTFTSTNELKRRVAITLVWFLISLLISLFIPDIDKVISFIGGISIIFIFIFPGMCIIKKISSIKFSNNDHRTPLKYQTISNDQRDTSQVHKFNKCFKYSLSALSIFFIFLGVVIFVMTMVMSTIKLVHPSASLTC